LEVAERRPRSPGSRSASNLCALARTVFRQRLLEQWLELAGGGVPLDLSVPIRPVEFEHPVSQFRELGPGKLPDLLFNLLNTTHISLHRSAITTQVKRRGSAAGPPTSPPPS